MRRILGAILIAGIVAGVAGGLLSLANHGIEALAMGHPYFTDPQGVATVPLWRRLGVPVAGGLLAGLIWTRLRRRGAMTSVAQAVDPSDPRPVSPGTVVDALAQLIAVGSGISLGRETAPRQITGYLGHVLAGKLHLGTEGRRTIIATASAAGLSAVYNVPVAGAIYSLELILKPDLRTRKGWLEVLAAAVVSGLATVVSWIFHGNHPIYRLPAPRPIPLTWGFALTLVLVALAGLVGGALLGRGFSLAKRRKVPAPAVWWAVPIGSAVVSAIALLVPQVPGNGQIMVQRVLAPPVLLGTLGLMAVAKAAATMVALRTSATGGLLTPALAVGACLGAIVATVCGQTSSQAMVLFAVTGAGCLLAVTQRAPLFALAFAVELAKPPLPVMAAAVVGVALTWAGYLAARQLESHHGRAAREQEK